MRILFINQFFWPDAAPTGMYLEDLARELVQQGHEVDVLCGEGKYEGAASASEPPPVTIRRIAVSNYSRSGAARLLNWFSFLVRAVLRTLTLPRYDVVVTMTTPPALSYAGLFPLARRARLWIWEMDLYPDVAAATGTLRSGSVLVRILEAVLDWPRRRAQGILVLGECMRDRLLRRGLQPSQIFIAENWSDASKFEATPPPPSPPLRVLYSGNLGVVHEIETILGVMTTLKDDPAIQFVFAGGGVRYTELQTLCRESGLHNVSFEGYENGDHFARRLEACHIGLVTLRPGCEGTVVPSKFYSLLAAGRPVLFLGPGAATPARRILEHRCGWTFGPGEVQAVADLLNGLARNPAEIETRGMNGRQIFLSVFNRQVAVPRLARLICETGAPAPETT
jgi:colanic acid biosynthesis glycosyl transferase WcaI